MSFSVKTERSFESACVEVEVSLDDAVRWISDNLKPEEVFAHADLADWATQNGYQEEAE